MIIMVKIVIIVIMVIMVIIVKIIKMTKIEYFYKILLNIPNYQTAKWLILTPIHLVQ